MSQTKPFFIPQKEFDLINQMNEELIDESVGQSVDIYKVNIDKTVGRISVQNDGEGIDVAIHPEHKIYIPEMIFGNLFNLND